MRRFLSKSISSFNQNKLNGLLAEVDFRNHLQTLGFGDRVTRGGWIFRSEGAGTFGRNVTALFPETIGPIDDYAPNRIPGDPPLGLLTMASNLHQTGIRAYYCSPTVVRSDVADSIEWRSMQLGLPTQVGYAPFPDNITGYNRRPRRYNFLKYHTDVSAIPEFSIPEEFSKEHLRVTFQNFYMSEISDIDGIFYGQRMTYPIEIKEKTCAPDRRMGDYFGLDVGPFVKLAFYSAKRGNMHSLFVVREIDNPAIRNLIRWWFITYEQIAEFAAWTPVGGGKSMLGTASAVIKIPRAEFRELTSAALRDL